MGYPVYSTQFIGGRAAGAQALTYTVPAGFVAVVRSVDVTFLAAPGSSDYIGWGTLVSATNHYVDIVDPLPAGDFGRYQWRGDQVFNAGTVLRVTSSEQFDAWVSGFLLTV